MNRRLRKKQGNTYKLLKKAVRRKQKRKGKKCIDFAIIPIGNRDKQGLLREGWKQELQWATNWFIRLQEIEHPYFFEQRMHYRIDVFFSTARGGTNEKSPYYMNFYKEYDQAFVQSKFDLVVYAMKTDQFHYQIS